MPLEQTVKYAKDQDPAFAAWVEGVRGGENIRKCLQCGVCSGTCPVSLYMDYTPRQLMHLAREGFKREVLSSFTIWLCASCYSCRAECPKQIKVTDIMYAFKRRAIDEKVYPKKFPIPVLARSFSDMVLRNGRVNETILVIILFLKTNWFKFLGMIGLGFNLFRTGRMSFLPEKIKNRKELQTILQALDKTKSHPEAV